MEGNLRVIGKKINCTEEAFTLGLTVGPTMGSILRIKSRALVSTFGQTARGMRVNGLTVSNTGRVNSQIHRDVLVRGNGLMENVSGG